MDCVDEKLIDLASEGRIFFACKVKVFKNCICILQL